MRSLDSMPALAVRRLVFGVNAADGATTISSSNNSHACASAATLISTVVRRPSRIAEPAHDSCHE